MAAPHIRISTRASKLALWQSNWVADRLRELGAEVELVQVTTSGDVQQSGPIASVGLQGVFTKEVQALVLAEDAEIAVHSLKDLPTEQVDGLVLGAIPEREEVADALVTTKANSLEELPAGAIVGTGSLRRQAQLKHLRPDLKPQGIRGNVDTRLRKLDDGEYDAIVLAAAGLRRLGLEERITELLGPPQLLPAVGQGALGIECRADDTTTRQLLAQIDHRDTHQATEAERAMLSRLHGGCSAPVGAWARVDFETLHLEGLVANLEGTQILRAAAEGPIDDAQQIGHQVAQELIDDGAAQIIADARS